MCIIVAKSFVLQYAQRKFRIKYLFRRTLALCLFFFVANKYKHAVHSALRCCAPMECFIRPNESCLVFLSRWLQFIVL